VEPERAPGRSCQDGTPLLVSHQRAVRRGRWLWFNQLYTRLGVPSPDQTLFQQRRKMPSPDDPSGTQVR
jgi:hypothetical protein